MTTDSQAIINLCSHLAVREDIRPLTPGEYRTLVLRLMEAEKTPGDLLTLPEKDFSHVLQLDPEETVRVRRLLDRDLQPVLQRYQEMGIRLVTRADDDYPGMLKKKLQNAAPAILYCAGDTALLQKPLVGYVGSRDITQQDQEFADLCVRTTTARGYGVVSGGARGVDSVSATAALEKGGRVVEYLAEPMLRKLKNRDTVRDITEGRRLLVAIVNPDAPFRTSTAMARNRLIYAQSRATVVIRADLNTGGTWAGATDALSHGWCPLLCRNYPYPGNQALIQRGAIPIDEHWDGQLPCTGFAPEEADEQISFL